MANLLLFFRGGGGTPPNPPPTSTVNLNLIVDHWWPPRQVFKYIGGGDTDTPTPNVQPLPQAIYQTIRGAWEPIPWWPLPAVAPIATQPVVSQPIPASTPGFVEILRQAWEPPAPLPLQLGPIATQPVVSQPPPSANAALFESIRSAWDIAPPLPQTLLGAPQAQVIAAQPQPAPLRLETIRAAWDVVFSLPQTVGPLIQPGITPQPAVDAELAATIRAAWDAPYVPLPALPQLAQGVVAPAVQVPYSIQAQLGAIEQWWPAQPLFRYIGGGDSDVQPIPAPAASQTNLGIIRGAWDVPVWWPLQQAPAVAAIQFAPAPLPAAAVPVGGSDDDDYRRLWRLDNSAERTRRREARLQAARQALGILPASTADEQVNLPETPQDFASDAVARIKTGATPPAVEHVPSKRTEGFESASTAPLTADEIAKKIAAPFEAKRQAQKAKFDAELEALYLEQRAKVADAREVNRQALIREGIEREIEQEREDEIVLLASLGIQGYEPSAQDIDDEDALLMLI